VGRVAEEEEEIAIEMPDFFGSPDCWEEALPKCSSMTGNNFDRIPPSSPI
jgi:hypothetical protein